jgi:hypothetical protein
MLQACRNSEPVNASFPEALYRFISLGLVGQLAPLPDQLQVLCFKCRVAIALGHVFALRRSGAVSFGLQ